jgi:hypothetical protein
MQIGFTHFPDTPIALKMGVATGIGMLVYPAVSLLFVQGGTKEIPE